MFVVFTGYYVTYKALRPTHDFRERARSVLVETGWSRMDLDDEPFVYGGNFVRLGKRPLTTQTIPS